MSTANKIKLPDQSTVDLHDVRITGIDSTPTANSGNVVTSGGVWSALDALPEPMIFKGSLGTGGTITSLPTASSANEGFTYKVITGGTYASQAAKIGDLFISNGSSWIWIPSGDEPSGTVISVGAGTGLSISGTASVNPTVNIASGYKLPTTNEWNGKVSGYGINNIQTLTQTQYDALATKDEHTLYYVKPADVATFGGIAICPAPLYYGANGFEIKDNDWNHDSYGVTYGKTTGSYYFSYLELGSYFDSHGSNFSPSTGDIDNANTISYRGLNWRMPTHDEVVKLFTDDTSIRPGATVNGNSGKHYSFVQLSGITVAGNSSPYGIILYPDGKTITISGISYFDSTSITTGVTSTILNNLISQGCVFLPATGYVSGPAGTMNINYFRNRGTMVRGYSATKDSSETNKALAFYINMSGSVIMNTNQWIWIDSGHANQWCAIRLVSSANNTYKLYVGDIFIADSYNAGKTFQELSERVATISPLSTNGQYPTAKAVYDKISEFVKRKDDDSVKGIAIGNINTNADGGPIGYNSLCHGLYNTAINSDECALGLQNYPWNNGGYDHSIFSIGFGVGASDLNAFAVGADGKVYVNGVGGYDGTNPSGASALDTVIRNKADTSSLGQAAFLGVGSVTQGELGLVPGGQVYNAVSAKAPTSHASSETTYGIGTTSNYGHVKLDNSVLTASSTNTDGVAAGLGHTHSQYSTTDTKNTAGSTDTSSKIFLVGATSQAANPQTYSDNEVYATSGVLTTKSVQVGGTAATMQYNSTLQAIEFVFA